MTAFTQIKYPLALLTSALPSRSLSLCFLSRCMAQLMVCYDYVREWNERKLVHALEPSEKVTNPIHLSLCDFVPRKSEL